MSKPRLVYCDLMTTCLFCRLPFTPYLTSKNQLTVFCSVTCRNRALASKQKGANNPGWKAGKVGYFGLHRWVRKHLSKPDRCSECNELKPLDLANISGTYQRDLSDWQWLCRRCHLYADGIIQNLVARSKARARPRCGVAECSKPHQAKGMCKMHYYRVYRQKRRSA